MKKKFTLSSVEARKDLATFLQRAARVGHESARLVANSGYLQVYVGILFPRGILDTTPTVLGLRVFSVAAEDNFDAVVPIMSLLSRVESSLAGGHQELELPSEAISLAWAAITPPRRGWRRRRGIASEVLSNSSALGVARVTQALPENIGEAILQKVRAEVWGTPLEENSRIPAGAAFATDALGFLSERMLQVHTVGNWVRLSSKSGYVLVRFHAVDDRWLENSD